VCAVYGVLRMALITIPDSYAQEPTRYLVKEFIARPVGTLALPWTTAVFTSWPVIPFMWAVTCVAGVATYAWRADSAVPPQTIVRYVIAVFVAVLPVYSILFITPDLENGRYVYLSTAFWVIALVAVASPSTGLTPGRGLYSVLPLSSGWSAFKCICRPGGKLHGSGNRCWPQQEIL
jgi:hypothetical protein